MFERDLGDGWKAEETVGSLGLWDPAGKFCGWVEKGDVCLVDDAPPVPVKVMLVWLTASAEWAKFHA
jgi:hypothetical protein